MSMSTWILNDGRASNYNQAIALAEIIDADYVVKDVIFNHTLCKLPNIVLQLISPLHINKDYLRELCNTQSQPPKVIISAGRRTSLLAIYLKKQFNYIPNIIQIMNPDISFKHFDIVIMPQHDNIHQIAHNIVRITGALNNIPKRIEHLDRKLHYANQTIDKFIAVIIGGDTKNYTFSHKATEELTVMLQGLTNRHNLPLFFSFSRRTSKLMKENIRKNFPFPNIIYDPLESDTAINPYIYMIANAEFIICTSDSISMCSEIASSGKPIYIYIPEDFALKKHTFFIGQLLDIGIARRLDARTNLLEIYSYEPLDEAKKIIGVIKSSISY